MSFLETPYTLTNEQIQAYRANGAIFLPGVAAKDEIARIHPVLKETVYAVHASKNAQGRIADYSSMFIQVSNVWRLNDTLKAFVLAQRFAKIAADLMGVDGVRIYHDQALFKPEGGKPTPWHQDQFYWPLDTPHTITMWMPLVDLTKEMGTMSFAHGSHTKGALIDMAISEESHKAYADLIASQKYPVASYDVAAGDATFHSGWTIHSAHANNSTTVREVLTVIYYADGARVAQPKNEYQRVDAEVFHPGIKPGEPAASAINPLAYKRT